MGIREERGELNSEKGMSVMAVADAMQSVVDEVDKYLTTYGDVNEAIRNLRYLWLLDAYNACWEWLHQDGGALSLLDRMLLEHDGGRFY